VGVAVAVGVGEGPNVGVTVGVAVAVAVAVAVGVADGVPAMIVSIFAIGSSGPDGTRSHPTNATARSTVR